MWRISRAFIAVVMGVVLAFFFVTPPFWNLDINDKFDQSATGILYVSLASLLTGVFIGYVARDRWKVCVPIVFMIYGVFVVIGPQMFVPRLDGVGLVVRLSILLMMLLVGAIIGKRMPAGRHPLQ